MKELAVNEYCRGCCTASTGKQNDSRELLFHLLYEDVEEMDVCFPGALFEVMSRVTSILGNEFHNEMFAERSL